MKTLTIGTELTVIPSSYKEYQGYPTICTFEHMYAVRKVLCTKHGLSTFRDQHCIEIPSPVFESKQQALDWYKSTTAILRSYSLYPKHNKTVDGGGHLNFGGLSIQKRIRVALDITDRPYIPWIFAEPDDTESCDNILASSGFAGALLRCQSVDWSFTPELINKQHCISVARIWSTSTLEYRCVEAPNNISEFEDQLDFFTAYTHHALTTLQSPFPFKTFEQLQAITPDECIYNFKLLLTQLNLPYSRYKKYVARNLLPRWQLGRERK